MQRTQTDWREASPIFCQLPVDALLQEEEVRKGGIF